MDYNHLPDCKHPHAPIDVCGCEVKILKAKVEALTARLDLLEANNFQHSKPYMVCVPKEIWAVAFQKQEGE